MRAGAAQIQAADGRPVARPARHRAHREHLVQAHLAVEDVAAGDAEAALQVERRQHLPVLDDGADVGRVLLDQRDHAVAERLAQFVPGALAQRVGRVLQEDAHDVLAGRGERGVVHGGDGQFQQRALGGAAVLGVVPGALHVVDAGADVHGGAVVRAGRAGVGA